MCFCYVLIKSRLKSFGMISGNCLPSTARVAWPMSAVAAAVVEAVAEEEEEEAVVEEAVAVEAVGSKSAGAVSDLA